MTRLQTEHERFLRRADEIATMGDKMPPLIDDKVNHLYGEISRLADRLKTCREEQKRLLDVLQIVSGIDFHVKLSTKKERGQEDVPAEVLALLKLAAATGSQKVRRNDGQIVRVNYLDDYKGLSNARTMFFFSTQPRPGVYAFPLDGGEISLAPVYEPITLEEKKNEK